LDLRCKKGMTIDIESAIYGRLSSKTCKAGSNIKTTNCASRKSTDKVKQKCNGHLIIGYPMILEYILYLMHVFTLTQARRPKRSATQAPSTDCRLRIFVLNSLYIAVNYVLLCGEISTTNVNNQ
jgi:hypothetical protein